MVVGSMDNGNNGSNNGSMDNLYHSPRPWLAAGTLTQAVPVAWDHLRRWLCKGSTGPRAECWGPRVFRHSSRCWHRAVTWDKSGSALPSATESCRAELEDKGGRDQNDFLLHAPGSSHKLQKPFEAFFFSSGIWKADKVFLRVTGKPGKSIGRSPLELHSSETAHQGDDTFIRAHAP